jgi:hypothetical protein
VLPRQQAFRKDFRQPIMGERIDTHDHFGHEIVKINEMKKATPMRGFVLIG